MHTDFPTLNSLFAQLGLPSSADEIETFINQHAPLPAAVPLAEAPFWAPAQAAYLREQILGDADWAEVVDQQNMRVR